MAPTILTLRFSKRLAPVALASALLAGCSSHPAAIAPPNVDPDDLSESLMADHDKDGNGSLSTQELEGVQAVLHRLSVYDVDKNGEVSFDELRSRLARVFDGKTGLMAAACRVTRNGKALKGAIVHFVPIAHLEDSLPVASGVTLSNGTTMLTIRPEDLPPNSPQRAGLVRPGLYFVEVTHPQVKIPDQYNSKTTLGREVSPEVALAGAIDLSLKF